jgi:hypothetical protein
MFKNSPNPVTAVESMPLQAQKRVLQVGSVDVLLNQPDLVPRVSCSKTIIVWIDKEVASSCSYTAADFHLAPLSDLTTQKPRLIRDSVLFRALVERMADAGRGRGRGRGVGNHRPEAVATGGNWQPQQQQMQQNFGPQQQPMGFGFAYPPPWGFPRQFLPQFLANPWVNS